MLRIRSLVYVNMQKTGAYVLLFIFCAVPAVSALLRKGYGLHSDVNMHMMSHLSGLSTWCLVFRVWNNDYNFQLKPCHRLCHRCDLCTYDSFFSRRNCIYTILDRIALILKRDCFFWCSCFSFLQNLNFYVVNLEDDSGFLFALSSVQFYYTLFPLRLII